MTYHRVHFHRHQFKEEKPEMKVFGQHHHNHSNPWDQAPPWAIELGFMVSLLIENTESMMSEVTDLKPALDAIDAKVSVVKTDVDTLLAKLANIPTGGLTPEQQAAIDDAVAHANIIAASLGAIDTTVNPPTP